MVKIAKLLVEIYTHTFKVVKDENIIPRIEVWVKYYICQYWVHEIYDLCLGRMCIDICSLGTANYNGYSNYTFMVMS